MIGKIWKKSKLNSERICKMWKKAKLNSKKIWKIQMHIPNQTLGATSDLAINVPQNIKETIQKGEYVDISVLLTNNQHNTDTNQKVIILGEATKRFHSSQWSKK